MGLSDDAARAAELYLDLLKKTLTRFIAGESYAEWAVPKSGKGVAKKLKYLAYLALSAPLARRDLVIMKGKEFDAAARRAGIDWPGDAETMIGLAALDHLQSCVETVLAERIPGDLIETGVWRGGASIFMRAVLEAFGETERTVWVADSFEGLPKPDAEQYPADAGDEHWTFPMLAVPVEEVKDNFERYGLLDDRVRFLVGWFKDTLPGAPIEELSILRLDGDMYESTMDALTALGHKVAPGGFVIIDDYAIPGCRAAVHDYRDERGITAPIQPAGEHRAYWRQGATA